jgi:two-component system LytT family response regulator
VTLRVIVADDEPLARARLIRLIQDTGHAEIVAECSSGKLTVEKSVDLNPDILFLDVQMPDLDGFGVIQAISRRASPRVVFVTAFDKYAVRAFDVHALDYLLKPYTKARFMEAFARASGTGDRNANASRLEALLADYVSSTKSSQASSPFLERMPVKVNGVIKIIRLSDVDFWETDGNYMRLRIGAASHLVRLTAGALEAQLDPRLFARIHRRYIVNLERVVEIQPYFAGDALVILRGGAKLRLSRTYRERLHEKLFGGSPEED